MYSLQHNTHSSIYWLWGNSLRFRNGLSNCIIATDIVDEGIDVQKCTLVIRYNLPMDVRSYVQSKGRARHSSSQYILLLPKDDSQYLERYKNFKTIEYHLKKVSVFPCISFLFFFFATAFICNGRLEITFYIRNISNILQAY